MKQPAARLTQSDGGLFFSFAFRALGARGGGFRGKCFYACSSPDTARSFTYSDGAHTLPQAPRIH